MNHPRSLTLPVVALAALWGLPAASLTQAASPAPATAARPAAAQVSPDANSAVTGSPGALAGVSAVSASDAWAAGYYITSQGVTRTLILRWNGNAWSRASSPNPAGGTNSDLLMSVSASAPSTAWAAGSYTTSQGATRTLILRWNGKAWSRVSSPSPGPGRVDILQSVAAVSATNAWAAGWYCASHCGGGAEVDKTLVLHWNGSAWRHVPSPSPGTGQQIALDSVTAISAADAWAAGYYTTSSEHFRTLVLHWHGGAWSTVPSPDPGPSMNFLDSVSASSATNAWAAGYYTDSTGAFRTLILRWNGAAWSKVASPSPSKAFGILDGVQAVSATSAWAAGYYCASRCSGGPEGNDDTLILRWNGRAWSQVTSPSPHLTGINSLAGVSSPPKSTTAAWAVGAYCPSIKCPSPTAVMVRWNGKAWLTG